MAVVIAPDDPAAPEVRRLLQRHLDFANTHSPREDVHALDVTGLQQPEISFFGARDEGVLLGVGALKQLDDSHAEIKSMHVAAEARGRGLGTTIVAHLLTVARDRGLNRVSLETGSMAAFDPARALYARAGFAPCGPFADYRLSPNSSFLTRTL